MRLVTQTHDRYEPEVEATLVDKYLKPVRRADVVSASEGVTGLDELRQAGRDGTYRHAVAIFVVAERKPPAS